MSFKLIFHENRKGATVNRAKLWWFKIQQLILGTGTTIWWATEPHYNFFGTFDFKSRNLSLSSEPNRKASKF